MPQLFVLEWATAHISMRGQVCRLAGTPPAVLCSMPLFQEYFITIDGIVKCSHEIFVPPLRGGMVKKMNELDLFRENINDLDAQLIGLLGHRFSICLQVAKYKKDHAISMMQPSRIEDVKRKCRLLGKQFNINGDFIDNLYTLIIDEACRLETEVMGN
ncbi:MAG: chorismate mutase [Tannerellaceae bacterium]|jgi:chorismate mutase|nr:chorismate mutase [Tannerellaceae bacterium]